MRRSRMHSGKLLLFGLFVLGIGARAHAGGVTLNRYVASETVDDGFYMSRPSDQGHLRLGVSLHLDYANDPLVWEAEQGDRDSEGASVVAHQLTSHLNVSLGLIDHFIVFTGFGANLLMKGDAWRNPETGALTETADGPGIGDWHVGLRGRIIGEPDDLVGLALQGNLIIPLAKAAGSDQNYSGESFVSFIPEILFEVRPGPVAINVNLGTQIRRDVDLGTVAVQDEFLYSLGLVVPILKETLDTHLEFFGATPFANFGDRESTTLEGLLGLKYYFAKRWAVGVSGGMGFTRGVGSPDFRTVAMLGWVMPKKEAPPPPPPPEKDSDGDGLLDSIDKCPLEPEDKDGFEDADGCPDPDNDQDGVADVDDGCPLRPEDKDAFEDEDGCPDPDNDADQIPDTEDECPNEPEDRDHFKDEDGCPDPDNDKDTVLDPDDECPLSPGAPDNNGCPKQVRLDEATGRIEIIDRVEFATNKDVILPKSEPILREVYDILHANDQIKKVRIEGHTDSRGKNKANLTLSKKRALSVQRWLVGAGLSAARFEAQGCGENLPISDNRTRKGRQTNRRVEFHILSPAPEGGARDTGEACESAK